jgi:ADP-sugar diphosphatase
VLRFHLELGGCPQINGVDVVVQFPKEFADLSDKIFEMKAFKDWQRALDSEFLVKSILIQSVDMFGPRVGFIKFKAQVSDKEGSTVPSIVFMRGASVAVLFVIRCEETGDQYTILTVQARFPTGKYHFADIPAGMVDGNGDFTGVAAKEMKEETGIEVVSLDWSIYLKWILKSDSLLQLLYAVFPQVNVKDLVDLTDLSADVAGVVNQGLMPGIYPSCGGCDEFMRFYACRKIMKLVRTVAIS